VAGQTVGTVPPASSLIRPTAPALIDGG